MTVLARVAFVPASGARLRAGLRSLSARAAGQPHPGHSWSRRETTVVLGAIGLVALAAALTWTVQGAVVPWDSKNHFYPMFRFLAGALAEGDVPLWNPYHFGGHPTAADPQSLLFTPSMVLFALAAPQASMALFDIVIMAHLAAGGMGLALVFRRRRWHPAGALLAALIFMLGGAASSRLQHTGMIISYAFFPLALLALEAMLDTRRLRHALGFGVLAAGMAMGRDQVAYLLCLTLIAAVLVHLARAPDGWAWLKARAGVLALAGFTGAALIAVPALLTLQFLGTSNRPGIAFGVAAAGSLAPVNFATMLAPNVFGSIDWNYDYWGPGYETLPIDWTDRAVNYLFIGTAPLLLLLWHGIAGGRLAQRGMRFAFAMGLSAALYAVGHYTPVFELVFDHLPGVSLYRRPADATFILNIAFALGAGWLLHAYVVSGLPRLRAAGLAIASVGVIALGAFALMMSSEGGHGFDAAAALAGGLALMAVAGAILVTGERCRARALAALVLVALTGGELLWRNAASSLNAEPASRYSAYDGMTPVERAGLEALRAEIAAKTERGRHPRVEILGLNGSWQNASMMLGLENTLGYNPLRIADYERAVGPGENAGDLNLRHFPGTFRGYKCALASLLGLEYLVLDRPIARLPRHVPRPKATQIFAGEGLYIYRLGAAAPRAYFASRVIATDSDGAIEGHAVPEFDRRNEALIDESSMPKLSADYTAAGEPAANSHVSIAAYHTDTLTIEADTDRPGVLVLHDLYYPGWEATVDGKPVPILRANILFRAIELPAGHHVVEFSFRPFSLANLGDAARRLLPLGKSEE